MNESEIHEKTLEPLLVASIRWRGRYDQCGEHFGRLFRKMGGAVSGKPKYVTEIQMMVG